MTNDELTNAIEAARDCAIVMLSNADYIQRELPDLEISDPLRASVEDICAQLVVTKHDILNEVHDLDEATNGKVGPPEAAQVMSRILQWIRRDISKLHEVVTALEDASGHDGRVSGAYILVAESAVNIMKASGAAHEAVPAGNSGESPAASDS